MTNTKLFVEVNDLQVTATLTSVLTSGMVGIPVTFQFDECWNELKKLAVFDNGKQKIFLDLDLVDDVTIPHEVLQEEGALVRVGVEGRKTDGTVVLPTRWADVGIVLSGAQATGDPAMEPTPSAYDQIMQAINDGKLQGPAGPQGEPGADGYTPQRGTDYWTEADKAAVVNDVLSALPIYGGEVEEA